MSASQAIEGIVSEHANALAAYRAHGARAALPLVTRASPAARVLAALAQRPRDLLAALDQIPRNTRLLYIHSYQSLIWNLVVSERLRKLPRTATVGDLVPLEEIQNEEIDEEFDDEENQSDSQIVDKSDNTNKDKTKNSEPEDEAKKVIPVKVLTQEDVDSGKYTIFDIVLPLPGHSVKYPPNMKEYYQELLEKDGLKMDLRHKYK
ncbi:unnamed protein product [Euphydryas editha]|uniref:TRUD domain-containing protein n=1 Tax=Euphydryas editha TaxID=104508 RepID=A0AAU9VEB2_EUPED|nr:unnamed protein product [Euphydryas editha]